MVASKPQELRKKEPTELCKLVQTYKKELLDLRAAQATNGLASKTGRIRVCRRNIARTLTILTEQHIGAARETYAKAKRQPRDLRPKMTRRKRQMMTPAQRSAMPVRAQKRQLNLPMRRIAIKAV